MNKDKRIEEMAEAIFQNCNCGIWFSEAEKISKFIIEEQGYRRADEVAREIFAEIERLTKNHGITYTQKVIAELKKKYTEDK